MQSIIIRYVLTNNYNIIMQSIKTYISAQRIPAGLSYSNGNSKLELLLTPEDTLEILHFLTTMDQRNTLRQEIAEHTQEKKVCFVSKRHFMIMSLSITLIVMYRISMSIAENYFTVTVWIWSPSQKRDKPNKAR